jgi:hypothetical protein
MEIGKPRSSRVEMWIGISGDALRITAPRHETGLGRVGGGLTRRVALSRPALTIGENGDQSRDSES